VKRIVFRIFGAIVLAYILACTYMYFRQEDFIFHPEKLKSTEKLSVSPTSKEIVLNTPDGEKISTVLSTVNQKEGAKVLFYLHGNSGNLKDQNEAAKFYNALGFDFFCLDYRSFGKSSGQQTNEETFFEDVRMAYSFIKKRYKEDSIVVIGYSLGTAPAAMISSENSPSKLVLIAPYYSLFDMTLIRYPWIPPFLLKYPFETDKHLKSVNAPTLLVHGKEDETIPFESSKKLAPFLNETSVFLPIKEQDHNNFEQNPVFARAISNFLKK
jgi:pimeloyl-ACP methyl ester carboxylesterase